MICLKICTFVVSKTTAFVILNLYTLLWFAWKSVPLWYLKQLTAFNGGTGYALWFAWKSVPLWYLKQQENTYHTKPYVVICLKICTFVVSKTTGDLVPIATAPLWFAWKSVPLWYLKQQRDYELAVEAGCDLLENLYLCGI